MLHQLLAHPALLLIAWGLIALAFGIGIGKAIRTADEREQQPEAPWWDPTATQVINWDERPAAWK